jgi:hypothetical protein
MVEFLLLVGYVLVCSQMGELVLMICLPTIRWAMQRGFLFRLFAAILVGIAFLLFLVFAALMGLLIVELCFG